MDKINTKIYSAGEKILFVRKKFKLSRANICSNFSRTTIENIEKEKGKLTKSIAMDIINCLEQICLINKFELDKYITIEWLLESKSSQVEHIANNIIIRLKEYKEKKKISLNSYTAIKNFLNDNVELLDTKKNIEIRTLLLEIIIPLSSSPESEIDMIESMCFINSCNIYFVNNNLYEESVLLIVKIVECFISIKQYRKAFEYVLLGLYLFDEKGLIHNVPLKNQLLYLKACTYTSMKKSSQSNEIINEIITSYDELKVKINILRAINCINEKDYTNAILIYANILKSTYEVSNIMLGDIYTDMCYCYLKNNDKINYKKYESLFWDGICEELPVNLYACKWLRLYVMTRQYKHIKRILTLIKSDVLSVPLNKTVKNKYAQELLCSMIDDDQIDIILDIEDLIASYKEYIDDNTLLELYFLLNRFYLKNNNTKKHLQYINLQDDVLYKKINLIKNK